MNILKKKNKILICIIINLIFVFMWQGYAKASENYFAELTLEIQNKKPVEIRNIIIQRYGKATRNHGSGISIQDWDVNGGVLVFHPLSGVGFIKGGRETRLIETTNLVKHNLFGDYEMYSLPDEKKHGAKYWIGNLILSEGKYEFNVNYQYSSLIKENNYFLFNPKGTVQIKFLNGVTPQSKLENIIDGTGIAKLIFVSENGNTHINYDIISSYPAMLLSFERAGKGSFIMKKSWKNHWNY